MDRRHKLFTKQSREMLEAVIEEMKEANERHLKRIREIFEEMNDDNR